MRVTTSSAGLMKWLVIAFIAVSTFLNYVDRQTLALLARPIQNELGIDEAGYAFLVTVFLTAYTFGNALCGWVVDRLGARFALPAFVAFWSIANAASGLVHDQHMMALTRFALGLAEVGNFIAAPVLVREYFPSQQRALAIGVYTATAMFGATVSPPLITWIHSLAGWRLAFILMGVAGLIWAAAWVVFILRRPAPVQSGDNQDTAASDDGDGNAIVFETWLAAFRTPTVWGVALGYMLTFPVWYFYLFWFPKYLTDERGLSVLAMGSLSWIVYLAAGLGSLGGGALSGALVKSGRKAASARLMVMIIACMVTPIGALNFFAPSVAVSLAVAAVVAFFHMFWQVNITAIQGDLFSSRSLSKAYTVTGIASGLSSIGATWLIGHLVATISYKPMFLVMASVYPIAATLVWLLIRKRV